MKSDVERVHVSIFTGLDVYHDFTLRSAATNMAIDEALLEVAKVPSIRFYRWKSPALSFGYFGKFADVADYAAERDLVRRWTGGGIVFHGDDLTYSIVIPASAPVFAESSMSIYENVHRALCNALIATGQRAALRQERQHRRAGTSGGADLCGVASRAGSAALGQRRSGGRARRAAQGPVHRVAPDGHARTQRRRGSGGTVREGVVHEVQ